MIDLETALNYLDDRVMYVSTDEPKWKRRIAKWAEEYPDDCRITVMPDVNDGCMCAKMPSSWLRMRPPKKMNLTEEQRRAASERMRKVSEGCWSEDEEEEGGEEDA